MGQITVNLVLTAFVSFASRQQSPPLLRPAVTTTPSHNFKPKILSATRTRSQPGAFASMLGGQEVPPPGSEPFLDIVLALPELWPFRAPDPWQGGLEPGNCQAWGPHHLGYTAHSLAVCDGPWLGISSVFTGT